MKTISKLQDLEKYGINYLTGEADNLMYRGLYDVTLAGYRLLCDVLGLRYRYPINDAEHEYEHIPEHEAHRPHWHVALPYPAKRHVYTTTPPGWAERMNPGSNSDPHVAGIMLTHDAWIWIAPIALLQYSGCHTAIATMDIKRGGYKAVYGLESGDKYTAAGYDWDKGEYTTPATIDREGGYGPRDWHDELMGKIVTVYKGSNHPHRGSRNIHRATGRSI